MAVGPIEIFKPREKIIENSEEEIDRLLRKSGKETGPITISTSLIGDITYGEFTKHLAPKYRTAGWGSVKWKSDQRDGDYLEFTP